MHEARPQIEAKGSRCSLENMPQRRKLHVLPRLPSFPYLSAPLCPPLCPSLLASIPPLPINPPSPVAHQTKVLVPFKLNCYSRYSHGVDLHGLGMALALAANGKQLRANARNRHCRVSARFTQPCYNVADWSMFLFCIPTWLMSCAVHFGTPC